MTRFSRCHRFAGRAVDGSGVRRAGGVESHRAPSPRGSAGGRPGDDHPDAGEREDLREVVWRLLTASLTADVETLRWLVTDDVWGCSPNLFVNSRAELLAQAAWLSDAFSDVEVSVDVAHTVGGQVAAEWLIELAFTGRLVLDEEHDVVVEPTGQRLEVAGATFIDLEGHRVRAFRHYFDDLAILQQVMIASGTL
jgi:hypothetical protein